MINLILTSILSVGLLSPAIYSDKKAFEEKIKRKEKTYVVFGADWCGPCVRLKRLLKEAKISHKILFLNASDPWASALLLELEYKGIPYTVVYQSGKPTGVVRAGFSDSLIFLLVNIDAD